MVVRDRVIAAAAAAVLFTSASLRAQTPSVPPSEAQAIKLADAAEPAPRQPLMGLLDKAGLARPLDNLGINIFGHIQGSYTYNFDDPDSETNFGRVFDFEHDELNLNQLDITVERKVDLAKKQFDIGGRMEWIYGADAGLIHSNGLFDWYDGPRDPENQWDLNQAYLDWGIPVGNGLLLRTGKFVTPMGYETINPTTNLFFSHSYLFGFAIPFTHTGVQAIYQLNDNWLVEGGVFRGWEQSVDDNNGAPSYHAKLAYTSNDKKLGVIGQFVTGPEQEDNTGNFRTVFDFIVTYAVTDAFLVALNADIGFEPNVPGLDDDANWYGVAGYASYKLSDMFTLNGRGEWFDDADGARTGVDTSLYELTVGLTITPFAKTNVLNNLVFRPELRADFADEDVFNDGEDDTQYTAAIDAIFKF